MFHADLDIVGIRGFKIVDLCLPEDESPGFDGSFFEGNSSGHIFDMLNDEID